MHTVARLNQPLLVNLVKILLLTYRRHKTQCCVIKRGCYIVDVVSSFPMFIKNITQICIIPVVTHLRSIPQDHKIPSSYSQKPILKALEGSSLDNVECYDISDAKPPYAFEQPITPYSLLPQGQAALKWPTLPPDCKTAFGPQRRKNKSTGGASIYHRHVC